MKKFYDSFVESFGYQPKTIIDIGSRDGDDSEMLRLLSNSNDIYVVEPHPDCANIIRKKYPNFKVFEVAISNFVGVVDFNAIDIGYNIEYVGTSSLLRKKVEVWGEQGVLTENKIKIISITGEMLLKLINKIEIDMVKIDVEGLTYNVIKSFGEMIKMIKMLHLEIEKKQLWENQKTSEAVKNYMMEMGFEELYEIPQHHNGIQCDSIWKKKNNYL